MRKFFITIMLIAAASAARSGEPDLIPLPAKIERHAGQFFLNDQTVVVADGPFTNETGLIAAELRLAEESRAETNRILLTTREAEGLGGEAYRLEINGQGVTIRSLSTAGAFYGCQTLRQLVAAGTRQVPFVTIEDAPRYAWRGLMLDVSRHFFDRPTILRLLDWMADYKLNRFHLHLTDDPAWRMESGKYPVLTQIGARGNYSDTNAPPQFFARAEMREMIEYAARRHIVIVPEVDMPGHASAATRALPQLDGGLHTFNPARKETYDFIQDVLLETMETFPSTWIHLGGDEVNCSAWSQDAEVMKELQADGMKDAQKLEGAFVNRWFGFVKSHGRAPAGWDDIVAANPESDAVIFWWRHDKPEILLQALRAGHPVVLAPRSPFYWDYPQDKTYPTTGWKLFNTAEAVYRGPAIPTNTPPEQLKQILGVEGCVWTEHIASVPYLEFMTMPRLAALSEMAWTPDARRDFAQFKVRLKPFLKQYQRHGIHYYDEADPAGTLRDAQSSYRVAPKSSESKP